MEPRCSEEGCDKPVNKDGVCLRHKLLSVNTDTGAIKRERRGDDVSGGAGTRKYVEDMYAARRAAGMEDPIPENKKAARYAPRRPIIDGGYI